MNHPDKMTLQATVEQDGANASKIDPQTWSLGFAWVARILILLAVFAAPWMMGSVEMWSQFWISTALLIALALWWFETAINKRNAQVVPYLGIFLVGGILIGLIQLVPLSGGLSEMFLGRQAELYQEFLQPSVDGETASSSARVSLNATGTWHQIRLLVIAIVAMLLCCRYFRTPRDLTLFLSVMSANGALISIFGIIQKFTTDGKTLFWSIPLELGGNPFGPYVNRNNSAGFLLICLACAIGLMYLLMSEKKNRGPIPIISKEIPFWRQASHYILYFVSELTGPKLASSLAIVFISTGIFASLSRGAVLAMLIATIVTIISYGTAKRPKNIGVVLLPLSIFIAMLTVWMGFSSDLISRFDQIDSTQEVEKWDLRVQTWKDSWPSVGEMGPLGSGLGTYDTISRLYRTDKETLIFRYAENQYLQSVVEAGWLGFVIYMLAWLLAFYYAYFLLKIGQSSVTVAAGITGVFLLWSQAVASFLDFGFYIPANLLAMSCTMGLIAYYAHSMAYRLKQKSFLRFQVPNTFVQFVLVAAFAATTMVTLDMNRKSRIEALKSSRDLRADSLTYLEIDQKINELTELTTNSPSVLASNELGRLGVHRARLELFEQFKADLPATETNENQTQRLWGQTSLVRILELSESLRRNSKLSQKRFLDQEPIQVYLPFAKGWFQNSLRLSPMQPEVQVVLGEVTAILLGIEAGSPYLERGVKLAPSNAVLLRQVAVIYLQAGEFESAAPHMSRYLDLVPKDFELLMHVTISNMTELLGKPDDELIMTKMLPDDPTLLYEFASLYAEPESLVQKTALEKAEEILETVSQSDSYVTVLKGRIKLAMGDLNAGIQFLGKALVNNPNDQEVRKELVDALVSEERYEDALKHVDDLIRGNDKNRSYRRLRDSIKSKLDEL